jgi:integral membrane protein (TIGR01906 family)
MTSKLTTLQRLARIVLLVCIPPLLLLSPLYVLATNAFVHYEYNKPDFPPADFYDPAERLRLAEATVHYLRSNAGPDYLWELSSQGQEVYNPREVKHMVDVKTVMSAAFWVHGICALLALLAAVFLWTRPGGKRNVLRTVYQGCAALLILMVVIGVLAYTSFDWFFVLFHRVFFQGDSWLFAYSDTLIQLFPVQFWMDATAGMAVLAVAASVLLGGVAYVLSRRVRAA